ncbi:MAG: secretin N-terminal domain-containing protein [Candidatus Omnitrophica bacterium]|nr:secretin N-terminal domain-containing protein [Candidatus Omnitrophota bacterium]
MKSRLPKIFSLLIICLFCRIIFSFAQEAGRFPRLSMPKAAESVVSSPVLSKDVFPDTTVSLELHDMDIVEALKYIASKASINIIPTKEVTGRVSLSVDNVSVKDVFDIILRSNNLAYEKIGNIYNVMSENEYKTHYGRNFSDFRVTKIYHLKYAVPEQALNLLNTLKSDIGKILLDAESGVVLVMDTPERVAEMDSVLVAMEQKCVIKVFDLKYARAKDIEEQLKSQLDLKKVGTVKSDERTNQVIVQTLPDRMDDIAKLITGLDHKTKQILMDAKIIQVKLTNQLDSGVQWQGLFNLGDKFGVNYLGSYPFSSVGPSPTAASNNFRTRQQVLQDTGGNIGSYPFTGTTSDFSAGTVSTGTSEMHLGTVGRNDYDTVIKYLQTLGETRVLSNPKLAVVNNQEAKIHVGERQAYITTTTTQTQTSTTVSEAVTYVDVGIQLFVTPTINDDRFVTVKIKPEISSVLSYLTTSSNNKIPIIDTSTAETIVMVKDGTSILIGGLSKEEKSTNSQGTPFLSKIPLIGEAFRTKTNAYARTELVVLLTPHIIEGDELVTGYSRDLGYKMDKEYEQYNEFSEEKKPEPLDSKPYQNYPALRGEIEAVPVIKPAKNF